ncbi:MAG: hypothetical protein K0B84_07230 [Firmicutes bacterium]|nr:hypothetical protein [Bacillota bacterium]
MIKKLLLVLIIIGFLLSAAGCGSDEPAVVEEDTITVEVTNNTEDIIISWAAFFGPNLDEWGEDMLGDEVIEPGEAYAFVLPEGEYNMALFTYELYVVYSEWEITGDRSIEVGGEGKVPVLIENKLDKDIALVFISPSESDDWGEDLLGHDVILAETGGRIFFLDPGTYDVMAIDVDTEVIFDVREMEIDSRRVFRVE